LLTDYFSCLGIMLLAKEEGCHLSERVMPRVDSLLRRRRLLLLLLWRLCLWSRWDLSHPLFHRYIADLLWLWLWLA
jgi:hypothetical protein